MIPIIVKPEMIWIFTASGMAETAAISGVNINIDLI
jgi:hypothetical protein